MSGQEDHRRTRRSSLLSELKRRRVYRVAAAYAAAAFVFWQVADIAVPALGLPAWVMTLIVLGAVGGLPVAVALAWAFELGPGGVTRTRDVEDRLEGTSAVDSGRPPAQSAPLALRMAGLVGTVAFAALATWWLWPGKTLAFAEGDPVLVADFENATGDSTFDESLDAAFRIGLQESPHLTVHPESEVREVLRRMRRDPDERLTGEVAREIAQREGLPAVVVPSISSVGGRYVLAFTLFEPATGRIVASEQVRVDRAADVLEGLDELLRRLRDALGEPEATLSSHHRKLVDATTASLEALQLFSLGKDHLADAEWEDARRLFRQALALDTGFTSALASLGMVEFERFDREEGKKLLAMAVGRTGGLTRLESLGIQGFYADAVENDLEKAAEVYRTLTELYPHRSAPHHNLGWALHRSGLLEEAAESYGRALRIDPDLNLSYWGLSLTLLETGRLDSARVLARWKTGRDSGYVWGWDQLGWTLLGVDSLEAAISAFDRALRLNPKLVLDHYRLGHAQRLAGRPGAAAETFRRILEVDSTEHGAHYQLGLVLRKTGDSVAARDHLMAYLDVVARGATTDSPAHAYNHIEHALALIRLGEIEAGLAAARRALELDSASADVQFGMAQVQAALGRGEEAVRHLRAAFESGFSNYVWAKVHPDLEPLRGEPGFRQLIDRRLGRKR